MTTDIELENIENFVSAIYVYNGGEITLYSDGDAKFQKIVASWRGMLAQSHRMPAFGVSLNAETSKAIKEGVWVEFEFNQPLSSDGMRFEKLLINVVPEYTGFNVIRYNSDAGYDGRCFYFDLINHDMSDFYNTVTG